MIERDPPSEPDGDIPKEAVAMARLLANLSGRSVAGFFPDPVGDLSLEQMMADPSLVPPLDIGMQLMMFNDPQAAAQTILAGIIRSSAAERERLFAEVGGRELDKSGFYSYLLGLLHADWITTGSIAVDNVHRLIPEYGPMTSARPLEEWEVRDYYFTWFQILNLRPTQAQVAEALRRLPIRSDSTDTVVGEE